MIRDSGQRKCFNGKKFIFAVKRGFKESLEKVGSFTNVILSACHLNFFFAAKKKLSKDRKDNEGEKLIYRKKKKNADIRNQNKITNFIFVIIRWRQFV